MIVLNELKTVYTTKVRNILYYYIIFQSFYVINFKDEMEAKESGICEAILIFFSYVFFALTLPISIFLGIKIVKGKQIYT